MYRLLKLQNLYPFKSLGVSSPLSNQYSVRTCFLCKHNFTPGSLYLEIPSCFTRTEVKRHLSTKMRIAALNNVKTKKKHRPAKKYAELLEVTGNSSSETKASVSNLKAKHLSLLVDQPNTSLAQLHNLKKTKIRILPQTLSSIESLPSTGLHEPAVLSLEHKYALEQTRDTSEANQQHSELMEEYGIEEKGLLLHDPALQHLSPDLCYELASELEGVASHEMKDVEDMLRFEEIGLETLAPVNEKNAPLSKSKGTKKTAAKYNTSIKKDVREQMAKVKMEVLDKAGKEESLSRNLYAYLDICVGSGLQNRGLSTLSFYRQRNKRFKNLPKVTDIKLYNILLHGFASKGNIGKIREILAILAEDQIQQDCQSYAACFECIGRMPNSSSTERMLHRYHSDMIGRGFTLNDLLTKCDYIADQREVVLKVIKKLEPGFEPVIPPPDFSYSCNLLQDLNESPQNMRKSRFVSPAEGLMATDEIRKVVKKQIEMEMGDYIRVKTIERRSEPNETILHYRAKLEETKAGWEQTIKESFQRDFEAFRSQHNSYKTSRHLNLYPYLRALDPQQYTDIIMQEIRKLAEGSETFSPTTNQLYRDLGNQVRARYQVKFKANSGIMEKVESLYEKYCDWYLTPGDSPSMNTRQEWQRLIHEAQSGPTVIMDEKQWPSTVLAGVGKFLYNIIMRDIKIDVNVTKSNSKTKHLLPAFYTLFRTQGRLLKEEVKPHPILSRLFRGAAQEDLVFEVTSVPMLSPPLPWSSVTSGGYLVAKADIIRLPQQAVQQWQRLIETPKPQLYPALDSLNQLGAVPWTVNQPMLDVVISVFNSGGSLKLDIPEPPSACPPPDSITPEMSKQERFQAYRNRMALRRKKSEMYSLWCDALYRLSLANHFRNDVFWLPHNMDFRGRVYPCPPHLNHLGSDMARAILCFAKGEPLGPTGLDWLKIHLVNLTGLKKRDPVTKRLAYAEELMPKIMDSAKNPLKGGMWWAESDEPWQTLACCMEIACAVESADPTTHICRFPVHQDGSCNGLQHYAALGRDRVGAESVNLTPSHQPQDVYSCVAALVERERAKDAAAGVKVAQGLEGFIRRKVIKQTVMTTVYGVTRFGARLQIIRQLKDIDSFPKDIVWPASTYLVAKTFESLREMFTSTKEIQDWFTECARLIAQVCGENVEWVTPLGLPVVQPYNRFNRKDVQKGSNKLQEHYSMDMFERPNVMKQKNAFPPNFIHSLDSSHMMLTSLHCERQGITFVSVHDCFWTHPSSIDTMNKVCREQFVSLHSQPILEELSQFLVKRYAYGEKDIGQGRSVADVTKRRLNRVLVQLPETGDFQIESVLKSVYFFS